jgi:glucose-1-phosphate thymidylyltransferase
MRYKKGIIIAAGKGTRLSPATTLTSKPLLPIFDKPMIYYALSNLMEAGVREVLFISRKEDVVSFSKLLGNGRKLGMKFSFAHQRKQIGIPDAISIGENFISKDSFILALSDNLFIGKNFKKVINQVQKIKVGAAVLAVKTKYPSKSAVILFNNKKDIISIEEKPKKPKSNDTIPGFYFYDKTSIAYVKKLKPSNRGELEIVDVHKYYLNNNQLKVFQLKRDIKWFDTGDANEMLEASNYVQKYQKLNNTLIGSIELTAFKNNWINKTRFKDLVKKLPDSEYKKKLKTYF